MTRWDWTWEDRSQKARAPSVEPDAPSDPDAQTSTDALTGGDWGPRRGRHGADRALGDLDLGTQLTQRLRVQAIPAGKATRGHPLAQPGRRRGGRDQARTEGDRLSLGLHAGRDERGLARQRGGAHLRRRARPVYAAAGGGAGQPARARDLLRDGQPGAVFLRRNRRRDRLFFCGYRYHRDPSDDGQPVSSRPARTALRTDGPGRGARCQAASPLPPTLWLVQCHHLPRAPPPSPVDDPVVGGYRRLHLAGHSSDRATRA